MKITPLFESLHSGENLSRLIRLEVDPGQEDKTVRLGFVTPEGKSYISEALVLTQRAAEYSLPASLLDGRGTLYVQLIVLDGEQYAAKSKIYSFPVFFSLDDRSGPAADTDAALMSTSLIFDYLAAKADAGHTHDGRYYTKEETAALLAAVPPVPTAVSELENDAGYINGQSFFDAAAVHSLSLGRYEGSGVGAYSSALGEGTEAAEESQLAMGKYNAADGGQYALIMGNGRDNESRSNAHVIKWNGDAWFAGDLMTGGSGIDDPGAKKLADTAFVASALSGKADKEPGKGLSTNDFTTAEKNTLAGLADIKDTDGNIMMHGRAVQGFVRQLNEGERLNSVTVSGIYFCRWSGAPLPDSDYPVNKMGILEVILYDVSFIVQRYTSTRNIVYVRKRLNNIWSAWEQNANISDLESKVDKVSGRGLSTNDFTTAEKNKLSHLENYVPAYTVEVSVTAPGADTAGNVITLVTE